MALPIAQQIYSDIRESIISGRLQPGDMLGEGKLATQYESSKMPVREALHQLVKEEYLISYPRRGYVVSNINENDFIEIQELRKAMEMLSLELIIKNASDTEIKKIYHVLDETQEMKDLSGFSKIAVINKRFHLALAVLSGNKRLEKMLNHLMDEISRAGYKFFSLTALEQRNYHKQIIDALLERNIDKAKEILALDLFIPMPEV